MNLSAETVVNGMMGGILAVMVIWTSIEAWRKRRSDRRKNEPIEKARDNLKVVA